MKIINCGKGIHRREAAGVDKLGQLPDAWFAFTNLDLALPGKGLREIDVIMVIDDRMILADLKDWVGPITTRDGNWFNRKKDCGGSPVKKIADNARELLQLLKRFLAEQNQKEPGLTRPLRTPLLCSAVVLTGTTDRNGIALSERDSVFDIDAFMRILRNPSDRTTCFGESFDKHANLASDEWLKRFRRFFNTSDGIFRAGSRRYGGFRALPQSEVHTFRHESGIFAEFDVEEEGVDNSAGLLRRWDFGSANIQFQTEEGRAQIAGRERSVIAWLEDRNPRCGEAVFRPKAEDPDQGVNYWEVFAKRRRLQRLSDFATTILPTLAPKQRFDLATQVMSQVAQIHELQAAHLDIGLHSIWVELPTTIRLSHLMAASVPTVETLGESRFHFLSSSSVPENVLGMVSDARRKDVFLLGCVVHTFIFGSYPEGLPPEWNPAIDLDGIQAGLHPWFARSLDLDPNSRFASAAAMLEAFSTCDTSRALLSETRVGLERFKSLPTQRQIYKAYPETQVVTETERLIAWRSTTETSDDFVKLWSMVGIGDVAAEGPRILAFLQRAHLLIDAPLPGVAPVRAVHWTEDAIVLVTKFIEGASLSSACAISRMLGHVAASVTFVSKLIAVIEALHERSMAHGDLKPDNIVVHAADGGPSPVLIDMFDFAPLSDGERISRAYAPPVGGAFERDRYAVGQIALELLEPWASQIPRWTGIVSAIAESRNSSPPNATLIAVREAISVAMEPEIVRPGPRYSISLIGLAMGEFFADEGIYGLSKQGTELVIRGATEELRIEFSKDGRPDRGSRRDLAQGQIPRLRRSEFSTIEGSIVVEENARGLGALRDLLVAAETVRAERTPAALKRPTLDQPEQLETLAVENELDRLADDPGHEPSLASRVDVRQLWRRSVDLESELQTELTVLGESSVRSGRHVCPVQITLGSIDFNRDDTVTVLRLGSKGEWKKIGHVDLRVTTEDFLAFRTWLDNTRGPLLQDGNRVRLESRFESVSLERRVSAVERILGGRSAISRLIDVFNPASSITPQIFDLDIDEDSIALRYGLNQRQVNAFVKTIRARPVGLLQGPPGTGKTQFIGALVHYVLTNNLATNVLLASQSHEAVNNAAEAVLSLFGPDRGALSLIRVGAEGSVSEALRPFHVQRAEAAYKERFAATLRTRLLPVAAALGLDESDLDRVLLVERTLRPIAERIADLEAVEDAKDRVNSLRATLSALLESNGFEEDVAALPADQIQGRLSVLLHGNARGRKGPAVEKLREATQLGDDIVSSVSTWQRTFETFLAGTRQVVAGTCVGLGRSALGLTKTMFDLVVIDEAARCTASELAVAIQSGKWIVLVGDHAQLEPQHPEGVVALLAEELSISADDVQKSDFERLFESEYGRQAGSSLNVQFRMLPPIGRLVSSAFYDRALQHGRSTSIVEVEHMPYGLEHPLLWLSTDTAGREGYQRKSDRSSSLHNPLETDTIIALLKKWSEHEPFLAWLSEAGAIDATIGIICSYAAQRDAVWRRLQSENFSDVLRRSIKVDTIDSYQGKQNLIVIVSLVRNNVDGPLDNGARTIAPGFMSKRNRINVALSRAQDRLVIVGAKTHWRSGSPMALVACAFDAEVQSGTARTIDCKVMLDAAEQPTGKKKKGKKDKQKRASKAEVEGT